MIAVAITDLKQDQTLKFKTKILVWKQRPKF